MKMGPILNLLFKDRFDFMGWAIFPRRMSLAEVCFIILCIYELGRLILWARS